MKARQKRLTTTVDREELRKFRKIARYVRGFSGPVSNAEVLRFVIRAWGEWWSKS